MTVQDGFGHGAHGCCHFLCFLLSGVPDKSGKVFPNSKPWATKSLNVLLNRCTAGRTTSQNVMSWRKKSEN